jgi:O-acetyl-ADP-ribose deacetylase (regulator of RNase III)
MASRSGFDGHPALGRVTVTVGDIRHEAVDAIVNAANSALRRGGGVDGAIHAAAGPGLQAELDGIGGCPTGDCRITGAHDLPHRAILHCVGPVWRGGGQGEDALLASCYRRALDLARAHGIATLAFPAISTGIYGFPPDRAARVAMTTVLDDLGAHSTPREVRLVCFDKGNASIYLRLIFGSK